MIKATNLFPTDFQLRFYLRNKRTSKPTDVIYSFRWRGNRINTTRSIKVIPDQWDSKRQRAIVSHRLAEIYNVANEQTNKRLDKDHQLFEELVEDICQNPQKIAIFAQIIKESYMQRKKQKPSVKTDIFEVIRKSVTNNNTINENSRKNYINKGLKAFKSFSDYREKSGRGKIDSFEMIDSDLLAEFTDFLKANNYKQDNGKPYAIGTLNSIIKYALSAIKCLPSEYIPKSKADCISCLFIQDKTAKDNEISLTNEEVMKLWNYSVANKPDEEIRDMFLLECTTGQRISDLPKVGAELQEKENLLYITFVQKKTSQKVTFPIIFQIAKEILIKYKDGLPTVNKDKINKNIKRIAKEAGINGEETISRHYSGSDKPTVVKKKRADLISSHTGRRTFVSLLSLRSWSYEEIAKYTGHTNIKTVQTYDKSTAVDKEEFKRIRPEHKVLFIEEVIHKNDQDKEKEAETAVAVLLRAATQLGFPIGNIKGGDTDLVSLSKFFKRKKKEIIDESGYEEYELIKAALQYGTSPKQQELMNRFFAMTNYRWKNRPLHFTRFEEAIDFWKNEKRREQLETE